jgi:hypothetical protein
VLDVGVGDGAGVGVGEGVGVGVGAFGHRPRSLWRKLQVVAGAVAA